MLNNLDVALKELRHNYKELRRIIFQKEKQIQFLETKAINLSMFYVASQLVIFLSNSKSSPCRKSWKPLFLLSLSISVAFAVNFAATVFKYVRTKFEQERNYFDQEQNFHEMAQLERLDRREENGHGRSTGLKIGIQYETRLDMFFMYQHYAHIGLTVAALLAITALVLHACRSSACSHSI